MMRAKQKNRSDTTAEASKGSLYFASRRRRRKRRKSRVAEENGNVLSSVLEKELADFLRIN